MYLARVCERKRAQDVEWYTCNRSVESTISKDTASPQCFGSRVQYRALIVTFRRTTMRDFCD